jgi:hypothetical protein
MNTVDRKKATARWHPSMFCVDFRDRNRYTSGGSGSGIDVKETK